ncbi:cutinase-domain-containing protein [Lindgomyces ingoldianus]|uniref:Cutinase-domain-containing protein n=1 Tax=Lindgomyces ingoldianus TaxID=673940 RepID=A0ACB6RAQ2_9PLEO|nr:cutinase-domain-containing protein [Lindgomyces ingoldianus]KAF2476177.1 cutinase-domain-containing protein [Lindgomyces ingoldianus]
MKHAEAYVLALVGLSNAAPMPQFSLPSGVSIPGFSLPAGFSLPSGGLPKPTRRPGFSIPSGGGFSGGLSISSAPALASTAEPTGTLPASVVATPTSRATQATSTTLADGGTVGSNCTPQGSGGGNTENGVADKNCCTDLTIVFARGTSEAGNVGTVAGPPMFKSLRSKLGANRVTIQGVNYPADAAGNINQGASGGPAMASSVKAALSQCPNTKVVVSGYSQGGMVVHNAFSAQGLTSTQVTAAVLFGDPMLRLGRVGDLSSTKVKEFCASGDAVCENGTGTITSAHLSYGKNADEAADFIINAAGLS